LVLLNCDGEGDLAELPATSTGSKANAKARIVCPTNQDQRLAEKQGELDRN